MEQLTLWQNIAIWIIPVLLAVTMHEIAHGWVASRLGDSTALVMGRITLNPLKHIDLVGTLLVPIACFILGGFVFGWAKPVPVNWQNLKNPKRDVMLVAAAGPLSNLMMAILWGFIARIGMGLSDQGTTSALFLAYVGFAGISSNLMLLLLNLIPIPPLDGSRIIATLLPRKGAMFYAGIERYGFMILLFLLVMDILPVFLDPPYLFLQKQIVDLIFR
jgi:Zn-dependent protease